MERGGAGGTHPPDHAVYLVITDLESKRKGGEENKDKEGGGERGKAQLCHLQKLYKQNKGLLPQLAHPREKGKPWPVGLSWGPKPTQPEAT